MFPFTSEAPALAGCVRHRRVLVIEDNHDAALALQLLLEASGHEVRVAHDGVEGIGIGRDWMPDVVLSDLGLPRLDGFAIAKALRSSGARLIALSGYADAETRRLAQASGFETVLAKPTPPDAILHLLDDCGG
jgi:CheY-like chemotaxis protein